MELSRLKVGVLFTGNQHCFTGRIEVIKVDEPNNILQVECSSIKEGHCSSWREEWNLQHTLWGFDSGEYFFPSEFYFSGQERIFGCNYLPTNK